MLLDRLVVAYTTAGNHGLGWVALGATQPRPLRTAVAVWGTLAANYGVKLAVDRERPAAADAMIQLPSSSSFPSSHAAMSTAAAIVLSQARPQLAPLWVVLAGAMCLSRLYVGAHHASDVAAGVALGAVTGSIAVAVS
jgi:undecaprenyl-diphosphatase